ALAGAGKSRRAKRGRGRGAHVVADPGQGVSGQRPGQESAGGDSPVDRASGAQAVCRVDFRRGNDNSATGRCGRARRTGRSANGRPHRGTGRCESVVTRRDRPAVSRQETGREGRSDRPTRDQDAKPDPDCRFGGQEMTGTVNNRMVTTKYRTTPILAE